jgi:hypothetical protein
MVVYCKRVFMTKKNSIQFLMVSVLLVLGSLALRANDPVSKPQTPRVFSYHSTVSVYDSLNLETLSYRTFERAYKGFLHLWKNGHIKNEYLTIIDYNLSSTKKRLWIIDVEKVKLVHHDYVAHGRNSGLEYAERFSNTPSSNMSSLGFFITGETYYGKHGLSLRIKGIEQNINDNAHARAIVMHSANYVSEHFIKRYGRLGRSLGCPAIPAAEHKKIIPAIAGKSCMFINSEVSDYLSSSELIKESSESILNRLTYIEPIKPQELLKEFRF